MQVSKRKAVKTTIFIEFCNRAKYKSVQRTNTLKQTKMNHVEIIVPVAFFGAIFGIIVLVTYYRNRRIERTALIASGKDASIFKEQQEKNWIYSLKYGIFLIGLAIGIIVGDILATHRIMTEPVAYLSMIFLFGGLALLTFFLLAKPKRLKGPRDSYEA